MAIKPLPATRPRGVGGVRRVDDTVLRARDAATAAATLVPAKAPLSDAHEFDAFLLDRPKFAPPRAVLTTSGARVTARPVGPMRLEGGVQPAFRAAAASAPEWEVCVPGVLARSELSSLAFDQDVEKGSHVAIPVRTVRTPVEVHGEAAAARVAGRDTKPAKYRFTNRGLRVLVTLGFALSIGIGAAIGSAMAAEPGAGDAAMVVVKPGDSLWSIASSLTDPGEDVRPVLYAIYELNDLQDSAIAAGQSLVVPAE